MGVLGAMFPAFFESDFESECDSESECESCSGDMKVWISVNCRLPSSLTIAICITVMIIAIYAICFKVQTKFSACFEMRQTSTCLKTAWRGFSNWDKKAQIVWKFELRMCISA